MRDGFFDWLSRASERRLMFPGSSPAQEPVLNLKRNERCLMRTITAAADRSAIRDLMVRSKSLAKRRSRLIHAKVRSTPIVWDVWNALSGRTARFYR